MFTLSAIFVHFVRQDVTAYVLYTWKQLQIAAVLRNMAFILLKTDGNAASGCQHEGV